MDFVINFLKSHKIAYTLYEHPAVFTCDEADKLCGDIPGIASKNLLLRNQKKNRYFLVVLPASKSMNIKKMTELVGEKKLSFASNESLQEKLGLEPGSVSPFGLVHDQEQNVELYIDQEIYQSEQVSFHPNVNTATLLLSKEMFQRYLQTISHKTNIVDW